MESKDFLEITLYTIIFILGVVYYSQEKNKEKIKKALMNYPFGKTFNYIISVSFFAVSIYVTCKMFIRGFDVDALKIALCSFYVCILNYLLFRNNLK